MVNRNINQQGTSIKLQIKPPFYLISPVTILQEMDDYYYDGRIWSAFEIHRRSFQIKIGVGTKVYSLINLISSHNGILREVSEFNNDMYQIDFAVYLGEFIELLKLKAHFTGDMIMSHVGNNDYISLCYEDDPTTYYSLSTVKQSETLANFSPLALFFICSVSFTSSMFREDLLYFLNQHSHNEDPVMIVITRKKVSFFLGEEKWPDFSKSYSPQNNECDIKFDIPFMCYKAKVTWNNRSSLFKASMDNDTSKACLHVYQHPFCSNDYYMIWNFAIKLNVTLDTCPTSTDNSLIVPNIDSIVPSQQDITNMSSSSSAEIVQPTGSDDEDVVLVPNLDEEDTFGNRLSNVFVVTKVGPSDLAASLESLIDQSFNGDTCCSGSNSVFIQPGFEASTSRDVPLQPRDDLVVGIIMFVYYPNDAIIENISD